MEDWNHNSAYFPLVLRSTPSGCRDVLDVGCGDGRLARSLAGPGRQVLGLDPSADMIGLARARGAGVPGLKFRQGAFLSQPFTPESFDLVSFVASLHHMDQRAGLLRAAELLRPGGRLVVVGLAATRSPMEWIVSGLCLPVVRLNNLRPSYAMAPGMPVKSADLSWREVRSLARRVLPGVRYRHRLYYRYSLVWTKPASADRSVSFRSVS
ncbi:class I SAM-dependent methyltransferase [Actinospica robiniae]|uniref:class I SAM-dependent methyltransferase n=1 Tax=Actinospica robiniae TaxID=304901 RepID=UPI001B7FA3D5|nr:class I SAM-dependent methyltransferase [Actinospica robiniae]